MEEPESIDPARVREISEELEAVYKGILDGMLIADIKTQTFVRFNSVITKMLGYSAVEFSSFGIADLFPKEYQADMLVMFKTMIPGRTEFIQDIPCLCKDGSIIYADIGMCQITFKQRFFNMVFFKDVTERKIALGKLEESEAKYHSIFNASADVMVMIDPGGTITDINKKVTALAGYQPQDIIGKKINALADIFTVKSLAIMVANFGKRMIGMDVNPYEVEAKTKAGEPLFFEVTAIPLKGPNKNNLGEIAVLHDITAYKTKN